jgi:phosphate transport system substrate-binding protein
LILVSKLVWYSICIIKYNIFVFAGVLSIKMKNMLKYIPILALLLFSCSRNPSDYGESPTTGNIKISVDETFRTIIDDEIKVFESLYIYGKIKPDYKPEIQTFNDLIKDSVHLIVASRKLTNDEKQYFNNKKIFPKETPIALDAVALIVNNGNNDTLLSVKNLRKILMGEITSWKQLNPKSNNNEAIKIVFDNTNSSTVRYVIDSITHSNKLSGNLSALTYNLDVVDFVSKNPNTIGIIGVSWVSDRKDSTVKSFLKKVKVMYVSRDDNATVDNSYQPYQAYIATNKYPLRRNIYVIDCDPKTGLASGFAGFLASDRGQRIILKAGILPVTQPIRLINVRNDF